MNDLSQKFLKIQIFQSFPTFFKVLIKWGNSGHFTHIPFYLHFSLFKTRLFYYELDGKLTLQFIKLTTFINT